jgi:serine/threonine protein phosphatase PrpC
MKSTNRLAMRLRVGAATDIGRVRDQNEDVYVSRADQGLFVVCDGMGGAPAGEVASQVAATAIVAELNGLPARQRSKHGDRGFLDQTQRLADAVRRSNAVVYRQAQQNATQAEMGTTVVGAWIQDQIVSVAHVGDSRAYLWHDDRLEALTRDHSLAEAEILAGLLEPDESQRSHHQNVLVRALGREPDVEVDLAEIPVQSGDYLLLCSDGLTRMVPDVTLAQIIDELRDPQSICDALIAAANSNGGADNITVIVVEVTGSWWRELSSRWRRKVRRNGEAHSAV